METAMHTDNPVLDAARHEDRAQAAADAADRTYRVMREHYRWTATQPHLRRHERVCPGPWAPAGMERDITFAQDFAFWVEQCHPHPTAVVAMLAADDADGPLNQYADARAQADADRGVEL